MKRKTGKARRFQYLYNIVFFYTGKALFWHAKVLFIRVFRRGKV